MKKRTIKWTPALIISLSILGCGGPANPTSNPPADSVISLLAVSGITAPVVGATPVTEITETGEYTGTVTWSPTVIGAFAASTEYTATITLSAKAGFTLTGVAENRFNVAGATVTNPKNSGVVTAVFPATLSFSLTMVSVPAGKLQRDAAVTNISTVSAFRMSLYEITRAQFLEIMGTDPSNVPSSNGTDNPVQYVNWYHAIAFCNKLSLAEGLTPVYSVSGITDWAALTYGSIPTISNAVWQAVTATWTSDGYRLPTEMEWMWAAMGAPENGQRGGTNTTGYLKTFAGSTGSNAIGNYAWYSVNSGGKTHAVGTKTANELGLYDMSGNVWEWCWDRYGPNPTGSVIDYRGGTEDYFRVFRGGSRFEDEWACPVALQYCDNPITTGFGIGFRVVRP